MSCNAEYTGILHDVAFCRKTSLYGANVTDCWITNQEYCMAGLSVLNGSGHTAIKWNPTAVAEGDPEALEAVHEAERVFAEHMAKGATALIVRPGVPAVRTDRIHLEEDVVIVPRIAGG